MYNFAMSDRKMAVLIFAKSLTRSIDTFGTRGEMRDPLVKNSITAHSIGFQACSNLFVE